MRIVKNIAAISLFMSAISLLAMDNPLSISEAAQQPDEKEAMLAAFHRAAKTNNVDNLIEALNKRPDYINQPDGDGYTALHWAAKLGHPGIVNRLLVLGADCSLVTKDGETAHQLAQAEFRHEIAKNIAIKLKEQRGDEEETSGEESNSNLCIACHDDLDDEDQTISRISENCQHMVHTACREILMLDPNHNKRCLICEAPISAQIMKIPAVTEATTKSPEDGVEVRELNAPTLVIPSAPPLEERELPQRGRSSFESRSSQPSQSKHFTGKKLAEWKGDTINGSSICATPDNKKIVLCSMDKAFRVWNIRVWDIETGRLLTESMTHVQDAFDRSSLCMTPDSRNIIVCTRAEISVWDIKNGKAEMRKGGTFTDMKVCVTPDSKKIVLYDNKGRILVLGRETGNCLREYEGKLDRETVKSLEESAHTLGIETGKSLKEYEPKTDKSASTVCVTSNSIEVITCYPPSISFNNSFVRIVDINKARPTTHAVKNFSSPIYFVCVKPNGIAFGSYDDGSVVSLDKKTGVHRVGNFGSIYSARVTPDTSKLVGFSPNRTIHVWDIVTGEQLAVCKGHTEGIFSLDVTPDGRMIVSSSHDKTVRVWDITTGNELARFDHSRPVTLAFLTPDGSKIVSQSDDGTICVWE